LGIAVVLVLRYLITNRFHDRIKPWILIAIMFALSAIVAFSSMFITGWDAGIVTNDAMSLAQGGEIGIDYYSLYPNNRLLLLLLTAIFKLGASLGLTGKTALYGSAVLLNCIVFWLTGVMLYDYLRIQHGKRAATFGTILYMLFISLSPWVLIVYTDSLGILFPVLILWLFTRLPDNSWWKSLIKWALIVIASVVSYNMKAPAFIILIAIIMRSLITAVSDFWKKTFFKDVITVILVTVSCVLLIKASDTMLDKAFENIAGIERDNNTALSAWHYLMMGHNDERDGTVNNDDVTFSIYISNYDERVSRNKAEFKERIKELWPDKLAYLYGRKLVMNYTDGSFGYALTGEDFIADPLTADSVLNTWIRFFYRPGNAGSNLLLNIEQILWLGILFMAFCSGIKRCTDNCSIYIALMGATAFITLFEAQARYLLIWAPLYIILASSGELIRISADRE
jgi:hypothetical protein